MPPDSIAETAALAYQRDTDEGFTPFCADDDAIVVAATLAEQALLVDGPDRETALEDANQTATVAIMGSFLDLLDDEPPAGIIELRPLRILVSAIEAGLPNLAMRLGKTVVELEFRAVMARGPNNEAEMKPIAARYEAVLEDAMPGYKDVPMAAFCGLSQNQFMDLIYGGDWVSTGPFRVDPSLSLAELEGSALLRDAREILTHVRDNGSLPPKDKDKDGIWPLIAGRMMAYTDLIEKTGRSVRITSDGEELLEDDKAGELFTLLFVTLFRDSSLEQIDDGGSEERGLDASIPACLWALGNQQRAWMSPADLAAACWTPAMRDEGNVELGTPSPNAGRAALTFEMRVLRPLVAFGLMDTTDRQEYRTTPLFARFLRFELRPAR